MRSVPFRIARLVRDRYFLRRIVVPGVLGFAESRYAITAARPGKWHHPDVRSEESAAWSHFPDLPATTGNRAYALAIFVLRIRSAAPV